MSQRSRCFRRAIFMRAEPSYNSSLWKYRALRSAPGSALRKSFVRCDLIGSWFGHLDLEPKSSLLCILVGAFLQRRCRITVQEPLSEEVSTVELPSHGRDTRPGDVYL
ncbi:hypothetical protein CALCODRAFT_499460 [Calocera cornea HHB12733]|uniref:Uncharacterized protein n=1 Tax=Calocera cornea HHB12733 TaxID=1353952 RepID=A0A165EFJ6_9BASI|nr:hypothetical protein CALCODRAFT_499460 [Calocera cornea HHB12733]